MSTVCTDDAIVGTGVAAVITTHPEVGADDSEAGAGVDLLCGGRAEVITDLPEVSAASPEACTNEPQVGAIGTKACANDPVSCAD